MDPTDPAREVRAIAKKPREDLLAMTTGLLVWALLFAIVAADPVPDPEPRREAACAIAPSGADCGEPVAGELRDIDRQLRSGLGRTDRIAPDPDRSSAHFDTRQAEWKMRRLGLWVVRLLTLPVFGLCLWVGSLWVAARPREIVLTPFTVRIGGRTEPWERVARASWSPGGCRVTLLDGGVFGLDESWTLAPGDERRLAAASGIASARTAAADPLDRSALEALSRLTERDGPP